MSPNRSPGSAERPRRARHERKHGEHLTRGRSRRIELLFIGDSITEGWKGAPEIWRREFGPYRPANFGISADRTEWLLWRLEESLEGLSPELVVLMIGTNNLKSGRTRDPPPEVARGVEAVVELIGRKLPGAHILLMSILPRQPHRYDWIDHAVRRTNRLIRPLGDAERVTYVNLHDRFLDDQGALRRALYRGDLLHLSRAGYAAWAEAIRPHIRSRLGREMSPTERTGGLSD